MQPIDQTTPITILIFDFKKMLSLFKWIINGNSNDLDEMFQGKRSKYFEHSLAMEFFENFPNLLHHVNRRLVGGEYPGRDILSAYHEDVLSPFWEKINDFPTLTKVGMEMLLGSYNKDLEISGLFSILPRFAFLFRESQKEVLSRFSREEQEHISTWQFQAPIIWLDAPKVCFYPEPSHEKMIYQGGVTSHGFSHGYGAILVSRNTDGLSVGAQAEENFCDEAEAKVNYFILEKSVV